MNFRKTETDVVLTDSFLLDLASQFQDDWKKILIYLEIPIQVDQLDHNQWGGQNFF